MANKKFSDKPNIATGDITDNSKSKCIPLTVVVGTPGDPAAATATVYITPDQLLKAMGITKTDGGLQWTSADGSRTFIAPAVNA